MLNRGKRSMINFLIMSRNVKISSQGLKTMMKNTKNCLKQMNKMPKKSLSNTKRNILP